MDKLYNCDCCGKQFIVNSSSWNKYQRGEQKTLTCSRECANKLKKKGSIVQCDNCGKNIYRTPYRLQSRDHQFCSLKCQKEFEHKETYEIRKCEICGKEFECPKISTQRFCCIQCQGKWQSTQLGILNPRSKRTLVKCDYCGKDIYVQNYKLKINQHNFCDEKCRQNWYAEIWSQTQEWKEKSSLRATKILSDGLIPFVLTKPQIVVNNILSNLGIKYQNDYNIKYYAIDNYLNDSGLMIEVMGDYWHSNPNVFEYTSLNEIQLNRIPKDKAKHTYVKKYYNVEILYLWESEIINNEDLCVELIKLYVSNNGLLSNYHSFNYVLQNKTITLSNNVVFPYYEYDIKKT